MNGSCDQAKDLGLNQQKVFKCSICEKRFEKATELKAHHSRCHPEYPHFKIFHCERCSRKYGHGGKFKAHIKTCFRQFSCEICGKLFAWSAELKVHYFRRHDILESEDKVQKSSMSSTLVSEGHVESNSGRMGSSLQEKDENLKLGTLFDPGLWDQSAAQAVNLVGLFESGKKDFEISQTCSLKEPNFIIKDNLEAAFDSNKREPPDYAARGSSDSADRVWTPSPMLPPLRSQSEEYAASQGLSADSGNNTRHLAFKFDQPEGDMNENNPPQKLRLMPSVLSSIYGFKF